MPATRPEQLTCPRPDNEPGESAKSASTALVPLAASTQWMPRAPSPDPTFVTQLIVNAQQLAERRRWPRDRTADALSAYHARQRGTRDAGLKTRQMI